MIEEPLNSGDVKARAVRGVASLLARQLLVRAIGVAGMLVLARVLTPAIFGVFAIAQFVVMAFEQISSLGLAAALLRRKEPVTDVELSTMFTVQQILVACSIVAILLAAPSIATHYRLGSSGESLIRVMAVSLLLASLKTIPSILLERRLRHDLIAASDVAEYLVYQIVAVVLALFDLGLWALAAAFIVRGLVGVIVLYSVSWWSPRFGIEWGALKRIVRFGFPLQLANLLGLANNAIAPLLVGSRLGTAAVGYANFSRSILDALVYQPLIIMSRVQFPVFSRMHDDRTRLAAALERSLYVSSLLTCLLTALIVAEARPFIELVATSKWSPSLMLLYVLGPAYLALAVAQPLTQALKALGDATTPLLGVILQTSVQVAAFYCFVGSLGLTSYAMGVGIGIVLNMALTLYRLRRFVHMAVLRGVCVPLACAGGAGGAALAINRSVDGAAGFALSAGCCVLIYGGLLAVFSGDRLGREIRDVVAALLPGSSVARAAATSVEGALVKMQCFR